MESLKNDCIEIAVAEHGAELQSLKKDGKEYLWQADARYWKRRSPVLFLRRDYLSSTSAPTSSSCFLSIDFSRI